MPLSGQPHGVTAGNSSNKLSKEAEKSGHIISILHKRKETVRVRAPYIVNVNEEIADEKNQQFRVLAANPKDPNLIPTTHIGSLRTTCNRGSIALLWPLWASAHIWYICLCAHTHTYTHTHIHRSQSRITPIVNSLMKSHSND